MMDWKRLLLGLSVAITADVSCSSNDGTSPQTEGGTNPTMEFSVYLPPEIAARAKAFVDELTGPVCRRSQNCCPRLGLQPFANCAEQAAGLIVVGAIANTDMGTLDPNSFDYGFDETLARACLDAAKSAESDCVFDRERWTATCSQVLIVRRKNSVPRECNGEGDDVTCVARYGQGYACRSEWCARAVTVATGAACGPSIPDRTIKATCAESDVCYIDVCSPKLAIGQPCKSEEQCGQGSHCRDDGDGRYCVAGAPLGAACRGPDEILCEKGLECSCDQWGCANPRCVVHRFTGESCSSTAECGAAAEQCVNGLCTSQNTNWCERPQ